MYSTQSLQNPFETMLSKLTLRLYKWHFTFLYSMGYLPYKWNSATQSLSINDSWFRRISSMCFLTLLFLYNVNLATSIVDGFLWDTSPQKSVRLTLDLLYALCYLPAVFLFGVFYRKRREVAYFITQTQKLNQQLTGNMQDCEIAEKVEIYKH